MTRIGMRAVFGIVGLTVAACSQDPAATTGRRPRVNNDAGVDGSLPEDASAPVEAPTPVGAELPPGTFPTPPSVQFIGRFDESDALGPRAAWPGARVLARFDGTQVTATVTQTPGARGGPTQLDVLVDGVVQPSVAVSGAAQSVVVASGLAPGQHTIELQKRADSTGGTIRFDGLTFTGGLGLLAPPPRAVRRVEILGDSLVSGFGIDGDPTKCAGGAPADLDDARKSVGAVAARTLGAELYLTTADGKGLARNADGSTAATFPMIYGRTLPDVTDPPWGFAAFVPDVVVVVLGAADFASGPPPAELQTAYNQLLTELHYTRYYATTKVILAIWSQHHAASGVRPALEAIVDAVIAGRPNADKPHNTKLVFPEAGPADETGCQGHANAAHHANMAPLLANEIKAKTGWK